MLFENDIFSTPRKTGNRPDDSMSASTLRSASNLATDKENAGAWEEGPTRKLEMNSAHVHKQRSATDRFIPVRRSGKTPYHMGQVENESPVKKLADSSSPSKKNEEETNNSEMTDSIMSSLLRAEMFGEGDLQSLSPVKYQNNNMLKFNQKVRPFDPLSIVDTYDRQDSNSPKKKSAHRKIPKVPFKVLDAPALQDDFYLNLLDWSDSNLLSVGLGSCVYLWSGTNSRVFKVCDLGSEDLVTSISWAKKGQLLGVGTNSGEVHIWDVNKVKRVRTLEGHSSRVGALAWSETALASGSRDKSILLRDIRVGENYFERLVGHKQEVCGLKWSYDDQMFCSGGNDNKMCIWTARSSAPIFKTSAHKAAVKALAWSPHQHGLLASGGGSADKCIRFWNAQTGKLVNCVDTGSQVCNLLFAKNRNELVSTHGFTDNQIHLWNYPQMGKMATLTGHTFRVLYLAMSPDGRSIVTGAGDETLRFWDLYPDTDSTHTTGLDEMVALHKVSIR